MVTLAVSSVTSTGATLTTSGASGSVEVQLSGREDFQFCPSPIYPATSGWNVSGLNQDADYFARSRSGGAWSNVVAFHTGAGGSRDLSVPAITVDAAVILRPNPVVGWTPGNEVAGYPARNVSRDSPVAWMSDGGSHSLVLEHSGAPWDTIAVLATNVSEAGTLAIGGGGDASAANGSTLYTGAFRASANVPGNMMGYHALVQLGAARTDRFTSIRIGGTIPGGRLYVEHVAIGLNRKTRNFALESTETPIHLGSKERTRSGNADLIRGRKMRRAEFDIAFVTDTQSETLLQEVSFWLDDTVLVVPNSKAGPFLHGRILYGDLKGGRRSKPTNLHATHTFAVESLL
jgi:hypothetical protein